MKSLTKKALVRKYLHQQKNKSSISRQLQSFLWKSFTFLHTRALLGSHSDTEGTISLVPLKQEKISENYINSMQDAYIKAQKTFLNNDYHRQSLFCTTESKDFSSCDYFTDGLYYLGKYSLYMLSSDIDDNLRIYYYKQLFKFFSLFLNSPKCTNKLLRKFCEVICKDTYNRNPEVGYLLISNLHLVLSKINSSDVRYSTILKEILTGQLLSIFIMYKTWNNIRIREKIIELIQMSKKSILALLSENLQNSEIQQELKILESLCEHICIRPEIKTELKKIFK